VTLPRAVLLCALALLAAAGSVRAQVEAPDAEEYAVWAAVLDSLAPEAREVRLADSAFVLEVAVGRRNDLMVAARMEFTRFDSAAIESFVVRNARGVRIGRFSARRPFRLVSTDLDEDFSLRLQGTHIVFISRPGFNEGRTRAVLSLAYYCGIWCGQGFVYALEREPGGVWRVARKETLWLT